MIGSISDVGASGVVFRRAGNAPTSDFAAILSSATNASSASQSTDGSSSGGTQVASLAGNPKTTLEDALAAFKKEASLTPAQRARRDVLEAMNLTEDSLKAMPPAQRKETEDAITTEVARRLRLAQTTPAADSNGHVATSPIDV